METDKNCYNCVNYATCHYRILFRDAISATPLTDESLQKSTWQRIFDKVGEICLMYKVKQNEQTNV